MSALSFLTRIADGSIKLLNAIQSSAGGADANKIIATNASGKLDNTLLPAGVAAKIETVTASEALTAGLFVNIYDDAGTSKARLAVANNSAKFASGFVLEDSLSGQPANVYIEGVNTIQTGTSGTRYFLSETSPGYATDTAPTPAAGVIQQVLGIGVESGILFEYDDYILLG